MVDVNALSMTLSNESKETFITKLKWWCKPGRKEKLRRWYQMGGWMNWAMNVYPRLRPALNNFYPKLRGHCDSTSLIWVNNNIQEDFSWAVKILESSSGIRLLKLVTWDSNDATLTIFCNACPKGMGFWYPDLDIAFYSPHRVMSTLTLFSTSKPSASTLLYLMLINGPHWDKMGISSFILTT